MTPPRHRWLPSFYLRTLFVLVTVLGTAGGWAAYQLNWVQERHEVLDRKDIGVVHNFYSPRLSAPKGLWLFGETGIQSLHVTAPPYTPDEVDRIQRLFPEAKIQYILFPVVGM